MSELQPGCVVLGKYRVTGHLGSGGMGVVVAAQHLTLGSLVAIKCMLSTAGESEESHARFLREAQAAARLTSPHVARVYDTGMLENGCPFMVMEYLDGVDMEVYLQQRGRLDPEEAAELIQQACDAISEAHEMGIIHRDIKPQNLFITRVRGKAVVKVLDFGISKANTNLGGSRGSNETRVNQVLGTPLYMSPEQMKSSRNVDARTDIWALGVILYELVVGRPPFDGETMTEIVTQVQIDGHKPLVQVRPDVPLAYAEIVEKCLEKDRNRRWASVRDLAKGLACATASSQKTPSVDALSSTVADPHLIASAVAEAPAVAALAAQALSSSSSSRQLVNTAGVGWGNTNPEKPFASRTRRLFTPMLAIGLFCLMGVTLVWYGRGPTMSSANGVAATPVSSARLLTAVVDGPAVSAPASSLNPPAIAATPEEPSPSASVHSTKRAPASRAQHDKASSSSNALRTPIQKTAARATAIGGTWDR